jgi:hypothetical protein
MPEESQHTVDAGQVIAYLQQQIATLSLESAIAKVERDDARRDLATVTEHLATVATRGTEDAVTAPPT